MNHQRSLDEQVYTLPKGTPRIESPWVKCRSRMAGRKEEVLMKREWRFLLALLVGLGVVLAPGAVAGWANPAPSPNGYNGRWDHDDHDRGRDHHGREREHHDRGEHRGWRRDHEGRYRFNEYDRRSVDEYYREHRDERWFRERGPRGFALGYGVVLEPRYRRYCRPMPPMMLRELPPPPPGLRYYIFGPNVVLVDPGYRVHDFIHLSINIGR